MAQIIPLHRADAPCDVEPPADYPIGVRFVEEPREGNAVAVVISFFAGMLFMAGLAQLIAWIIQP